MEAIEVAARLRACASEMKLASVTLRANADQLKETSRALAMKRPHCFIQFCWK